VPSLPSISRVCYAALGAVIALSLPGCTRHEEHVLEGSGHSELSPLSLSAQPLHGRQVVYAPVYSSIYLGFDRQLTDLPATLSMRNVIEKAAIVVYAVRYYDSYGN